MQLGLGAMHEADEERLTLAKQLGVPNIIIHTPPLRGDGYWEFQELLMLRTRVESYGLRLYAIECFPVSFYDKVMQGAPGRDEQIEKLCKLIRNVGRAGIHNLAYHWALDGMAHSTEYSPIGRGGATARRYDHAQVANAPISDIGSFSDEQEWESLTYFLKAVIPVAEQEGVMLGLHPSDPPVPSVYGIAHIIRSIDAMKRVIEIVDSPCNGFEFCQGTVAEMTDNVEDVYDAIRYFGSRNKISYVHFRNVRGAVPRFDETFIDDGKVDMLEAMRAYKEVNFEGVLIPDHTPHVVNDTNWGHRGRAYAIGYMKALMKAVGA